MRRKESKKKLPWKDLEVTKVKLNPEQAVLACCVAMGTTFPCLPGGGSSAT
jgi:hypothetical protein